MKGKVAIITGASSGIGLACAHEFAKRGAFLVLASRNLGKLNELQDKFNTDTFIALAVKTDVSIEEDCKNLIYQAFKRFGKIDYLINNAGVSMRALFSQVDLKVIRYLMEVNFFGAVYCTKYALPFIIETKGSIVGVSSIAGFHGLPARIGYSASKFALNGFLETLRIENLKNGLHVMIAAPRFTATNIRHSALTADGPPQGFSPRKETEMMTAEKVAKRIASGIKYRRRNIIMTSEGKLSVFVQRIFPHILDRIFYYHMSKELNSPLK